MWGRSFFFSSKNHFLTLSLVVLDFATNSHCFLTILMFISCSQKFTSRSPIFFGRSRGRFTVTEGATCRTSAAVLTKKKSSPNLLVFINRVTRACLVRRPIFFLKKSACSPSAVNDFNKTYSISLVPLLVRNVSYVCGAVARNS